MKFREFDIIRDMFFSEIGNYFIFLKSCGAIIDELRNQTDLMRILIAQNERMRDELRKTEGE